MKRGAILLFISLHLTIFSQMSSDIVRLNDLRSKFMEASYNKTLLPTVEEALRSYPVDNDTKKAYLGAKIALTAKDNWNPLDQISTLKEGLKYINEAVDNSPNNIEIRFIRFATLHHVPTFLGLSSNLEPDRKFVFENISKIKELNISFEFASSIYKFIIESERFSKPELAILRDELVRLYAFKG